MFVRASRSAQMATIVMLVYLAAALLPAGRFVICIDGRSGVAIEAATEAGACSDCTEPSPCSNTDAGDRSTDCECVDLAIAQPERARVEPLTSFRLPSTQTALDVPARIAPTGLRTSPLYHEAPRPLGTLDALRTIVLRV